MTDALPSAADLGARERRRQQAVPSYERAADAGCPLAVSELLARYPDVADELRAYLADQARVGRLAPPRGPSRTRRHSPGTVSRPAAGRG